MEELLQRWAVVALGQEPLGEVECLGQRLEVEPLVAGVGYLQLVVPHRHSDSFYRTHYGKYCQSVKSFVSVGRSTFFLDRLVLSSSFCAFVLTSKNCPRRHN